MKPHGRSMPLGARHPGEMTLLDPIDRTPADLGAGKSGQMPTSGVEPPESTEVALSTTAGNGLAVFSLTGPRSREGTPAVSQCAATLAIRDAHVGDAFAVTQVLSEALAESSLGRWLDPDPQARRASLLGHVGGLVVETIASGIVRVVEDSGKIVGAALWASHSRVNQPAAVAQAASSADDPAALPLQRRGRLLKQLAENGCRRRVSHHRLVYLGVRPDRQGQGIGSYLLIGHHALLHVTETPACLLADGGRNRELFERHGYAGIGPPQILPGGLRVQAMWRPPLPADPL